MDRINRARIEFDKIIDYIPLASAINSAIDLIQKRRFTHKPEANLSDYQRHIIDKPTRKCLINMIPFGKIFDRILHRGKDKESNITQDEEQRATISTQATSSSLSAESDVIQDEEQRATISTPATSSSLSAETEDSISEESSFSSSEEVLPDFVKKYSELFKNHNNNTVEHFISEIINIPDLHEADRFSVIAYFIEKNETPLTALKNKTNRFWMALAPHLQTVVLKDIPKQYREKFVENCSNVRRLDCSDCSIRSLPNKMSQLQELDISRTRITKLPAEMPQLTHLNVSGTGITKLPAEMPQITHLNISRTGITELPAEMPQITNLNTSETTIFRLPAEMPQLTHLNISSMFISRLPAEMPQLTHLNILGTRISTLPAEMPQLQELSFFSVNFLTALPAELPQLRTLSCIQCNRLAILPPALPQCTLLNYSRSPSITELPQLPFGARVINENAAAFTSLNVHFEKFAACPRELLFNLGGFLLRNQSFPNVIYYNKDGNRNEAIDAGGVRRDFVTRLFEGVFRKNFRIENLEDKTYIDIPATDFLKITEDAIPQARPGVLNERETYQTLGVLMAYCFIARSGFKSGPVFDEKVYQFLQASYAPNSDEWFLHNMLENKLSPAIVAYFTNAQEALPAFAEKDLENLAVYFTPEDDAELTAEYIQANKEAIRNSLLKDAREDMSLLAISWMAEKMREKLGNDQWHVLQTMSPSALQDRVEGILTIKALKESLEWDFSPTVSQEDRTKTRDFLLNWIDTNSDIERLSLFVRAVTGNKTLNGDPIKIDVGRRGKEHLPITHTCFNTIELTSECESQEKFDEKLQMHFDIMQAVGFGAA